MAGSVANAAVWADADVFIAAEDAVAPVGGADFDTEDWTFVGLLNGDDGFNESRELESNDFYAWGGILVATTRRNFKLQRSFTTLEDNEAVFSIAWPGSDVTFDNEDYTGELSVPNLQHRFKIAFELETGDKIKRVICRNYTQVEEVGEVSESESDLATRPITVTIYPDDDGVLFDVYKGERASA